MTFYIGFVNLQNLIWVSLFLIYRTQEVASYPFVNMINFYPYPNFKVGQTVKGIQVITAAFCWENDPNWSQMVKSGKTSFIGIQRMLY